MQHHQSAVLGLSPHPLSLFDEDGFLINPNLWTNELASQLAEQAELGSLNKAHWNIIQFIREKYLNLGAIPPMRSICRKFGYERDAIQGLFGGCTQLWKVAGLPNPGEEAKAYMD